MAVRKTHKLKVWKEYYQDLYEKRKTWEMRQNDRDYQVGDDLLLEEYDKDKMEYTGNFVTLNVTYILHGPVFGLKKGYCVMSLV
jgi:hypothetical protein